METKKVKIFRYQNGIAQSTYDNVIEEKIYNLYVNGKHIYRFNTFDRDLEYLIIGYLFYKGIIGNYTDILSITKDSKTIKVETKNPTAITFSREKSNIDSDTVLSLMKKFQESNELFDLTGGVHSAAIANEKKILFKTDDISRHNCIDKVIGYWLKNLPDQKGLILLLTGRVNEKIMSKIIKAPISTIISRSAPTALAIEMAKKYDIVLIGFARGQRYNEY